MKKKKLDIQKPILLLDIDGVINCFDRTIPLEFYHQMLTWNNQLHWCSLPIGMMKKIQELDNVFEIHWCTAWEKNANNLARIVGISEKPFIPVCADNHPNISKELIIVNDCWKLPYIQDYVEQNLKNKPIMFIDDEIESDTWAQERNVTIPTVFRKINNRTGITEDDMIALRLFSDYNTITPHVVNESPELQELK